MTARCQCCLGWFRIRPDGDVRLHGLMSGRLCLGSNRPPAVDQ